ncbi:hypothetical protein QBC37DRAFT_300111 [Rhypophila decipiens]|uniref:Rhodopsin domain-containing protein n=1 Tax=Rhypophila decipiens TaxID=261697 RepID=A0AAN7B1T8_9PEZI|nr:hypothetical protein QBC37DRAFT_300111 [Rhypophila decipiens]
MTSPVLADPAVSAVFVVSVITAPLCIVAAILRFVAARRIGRRHGSEDWCAYGAVAIHLAYVSASIYSIVFLDNRPVLTLPPDELLYLGKLLTKMSFLLFYHRTFGVRRGYRIGIYVSASVVVAWFIAVLPLFLFSCRPISKGWDLLQPGTCLDYGSTVAGGETTNSAMDFVLVVQAWLMIQPLRMSVSTKWKLFTLFAAGALAGLAGFAKIFETYRTVGGAINYMTGFWAIIQMFFSIFCCCVMTYKPILPKNDFLGRVAGRIKHSLSFSSLNKTQSSQSVPSMEAQGSHEYPPTIGSASWLKLSERNRGIAMTSIWAETKTGSPGLDEDRDAGRSNGSLQVQQPNAIGVERKFEVA